MAGVDLKGLRSFNAKVALYKDIGKSYESIAEKLGERGVQIAQGKYQGVAAISVEKTGTAGQRKLIAKGEGLSFLEFGTGLVGKAKGYEGQLPTETIEFESPKNSGKMQKTQGWEYYYPNPLTKVNGGWFANGVFHRGQESKAQMYETSRQLRSEAGEIAKQILKGGIEK